MAARKPAAERKKTGPNGPMKPIRNRGQAERRPEMTDEELIARLRGRCDHDQYDPLADQAADRIEALVKERDAVIAARDTMGNLWAKEKARAERLVKERNEALNQLDSARYSVEVLEKRVAHFMALNARLEAAVLAAAKIGQIVGALGEDEGRIEAFREACGPELWAKARAALKGADHE